MEQVYTQLYCLFIFTIIGIIIGILFDIFRILRKSFKTTDFITYIEDILFWILAGIIILFSIFKFNNGEIRSYLFIGIVFGIIIYMLTISKYVIKYSVIIIKFLKKVISYPVNMIKNMFFKFVVKPIRYVIKQTLIIFKNKQNNTTKNNKKILKKSDKIKRKRRIFVKNVEK